MVYLPVHIVCEKLTTKTTIFYNKLKNFKYLLRKCQKLYQVDVKLLYKAAFSIMMNTTYKLKPTVFIYFTNNTLLSC